MSSTCATFLRVLALGIALHARTHAQGEVEPNNIPPGGSIPTTNVVVNAAIGAPGDVDCFSFNAGAGAVITVQTVSTSALVTDTVLELLAPSGLVVALNDDSGGTLYSSVTLPAVQGGLYVARVRHFSPSGTGAYGIKVSVIGGSSGGGGTGPSEVEPNNFPPGNGLPADNSIVSAAIGAPGDVDCFSFDASAGAQIALETVAMSSSTDTWLELIAPSGALVAADDDSGAGYFSLIVMPAVQSGLYVARIRHYSPSQTGAYGIKVSVTGGSSGGGGGSGGTGPSEVEPNNVPPGGSIPTTNVVVNAAIGAPGDVDCFSFNAGVGAQITAQTVVTSAAATDTVLELLAPNGSQVAVNDDSNGTPFSSLTFVANQSGLYVARVWHYSASQTGAYGIKVNVAGGSSGGGGAADDHPNAPPGTSLATNGIPLNGVLETGSDQDWFNITVGADLKYRIECTGAAGLAVTVTNAANATLASGASPLEFTATFTDLAYIKVQSSSQAIGSYQLKATFSDDFPNTGTGSLIATNGTNVSAKWEYAADVDLFAIAALAGEKFRVQVTGGSGVQLTVLTATGATLETGGTPLEFTAAAAGTLTIRVLMSGGPWNYAISVTSYGAQPPSLELLAGDKASDDRFGASVAQFQGRLIGGSPRHNKTGSSGKSDAGSATIYYWNGAFWASEAVLAHPSAGTDDKFGTSVAGSYPFAACGVPYDNTAFGSDSGSVQVFRNLSYGQWVFAAELKPTYGQSNEKFGYSLAMDGNRLVAGAPGRDGGRGAAYVFTWNGSSWSSPAALPLPALGSDAEFGFSVAVVDDRILVGAPGVDHDRGAAFVYRYSGTWQLDASLAPSVVGEARFGESVSIHGNIAVGAPAEDVYDADEAGAAYVFGYPSGGVCPQIDRVLNPDWDDEDHFGASVSIEVDALAVGAPGDDEKAGNAGAAYHFRLSEVSTQIVPPPPPHFLLQHKLMPQNGASGDELGKAVSLSTWGSPLYRALAAGAPRDNVPGGSGTLTDAGSIRVFDVD